MGRYLAPTAEAALKETCGKLKRTRVRYRELQHQESEYGRDIRAYIACLEAVEQVWLAALASPGGKPKKETKA